MFRGISEAIERFTQARIAELRAQAAATVRRARPGATVTAVGAVLALFALGILLGAAIAGLDLVLPHWLSMLLVGGVLAVAAAILLPVGIAKLRRLGNGPGARGAPGDRR
jgi:predicted MFS family arabinose efflux permease